MKYLFYLAHPAQFHLFRHTIKKLKEGNHKVTIIIKTKDVLENLLVESGYDYINVLPEGRKDTRAAIAFSLIKRDLKILTHCQDVKYNLMLGTPPETSHIGKILGVNSISVNEDDSEAVLLLAKLSYPLVSEILSPICCNNGIWNDKSIKYNSYHELAYLIPEYFTPCLSFLKQYSLMQPYSIIRFSKLNAYHDSGITGISNKLAHAIIKKIEKTCRVYITSEKELSSDLEKYRLHINPLHMHHVLAFANLFIGDSQTMTAEAAVLGTPALRYNGFVGRLGYLEELEHKYELAYGIKPSEPQTLLTRIDELLSISELKNTWKIRKNKMLNDKINLTEFMTWFIENYPESSTIMRLNPSYQNKFKIRSNN